MRFSLFPAELRLAESLYKLCITLWVGGMLAIGYVAAPVLFRQLDDRALAGRIAGEMFTLVAWLGIACGAYLLWFIGTRHGASAMKSRIFWLVLVMLILVVAGHFGVQPILVQLKQDALPLQVMESALRDRFAAWHGVSSALFLVQSGLGILLVMWQHYGLVGLGGQRTP